MVSTLAILRRLGAEGADFILVGGMACIAHGGSIATEDVDVCIPFTTENMAKVLRALAGAEPRQRMRPDRPPLSTNAADYAGWKNLYVVTNAGQIDFLGELTGLGPFEKLLDGAVTMDLGGFSCRIIGVEDLIRSKRAVGRPKDLRAAAELEHVRAHRPAKG